MKAFEYATAHSTDSARRLVTDKGAYLAGGNDLLGLLKEYLVSVIGTVSIDLSDLSPHHLQARYTGSPTWHPLSTVSTVSTGICFFAMGTVEAI
jgi:hypothetical protein